MGSTGSITFHSQELIKKKRENNTTTTKVALLNDHDPWVNDFYLHLRKKKKFYMEFHYCFGAVFLVVILSN